MLGLGFLAVAFLAGSANALTLSDIRSQARVLVSDSGSATSRLRFTNGQIDDLILDCQSEAVAQTWPIIRSSNIELVAGTTYYAVPNSFLAIKRMTWRNRVLSEKSPVALDQTKEWETVSGTPQNYFVTFASRTMIGIYPFPADSTSTGTVKVEFYAQANDITVDADVPFNGIREFYSFHHILAYCAAVRMAAIDGQTNLIQLYQQIYIQGLARLAGVAMARPSNNPSITPGIPAGP